MDFIHEKFVTASSPEEFQWVLYVEAVAYDGVELKVHTKGLSSAQYKLYADAATKLMDACHNGHEKLVVGPVSDAQLKRMSTNESIGKAKVLQSECLDAFVFSVRGDFLLSLGRDCLGFKLQTERTPRA